MTMPVMKTVMAAVMAAVVSAMVFTVVHVAGMSAMTMAASMAVLGKSRRRHKTNQDEANSGEDQSVQVCFHGSSPFPSRGGGRIVFVSILPDQHAPALDEWVNDTDLRQKLNFFPKKPQKNIFPAHRRDCNSFSSSGSTIQPRHFGLPHRQRAAFSAGQA